MLLEKKLKSVFKGTQMPYNTFHFHFPHVALPAKFKISFGEKETSRTEHST